MKVEFSDVVKSQPYVSAGSLCVDVTFGKSMSYRDARSVYYSSDELFGSPYHMTVVFSYDDFDGTCLIESVNGCVGNQDGPGNGHLVCLSDDVRGDIMFRNPGVPVRDGYYKIEECSPLAFDSYGQAFLPEDVVEEDWYYMQDVSKGWDPDVHVKARASRDGFLSFETSKNPFRAKVYNSTAAFGAFAVEGTADRKRSFSDEVGVEFRYMFDLGHRLNAGVYGALGVAYNYLDVAFEDLSYTYHETLKVAHAYDFEVIGQRYYMMDGVLSGGFAFEYAFARRWNADLHLGAKAYYNIWSKIGDMYCDYRALYSGEKEAVHVKGHFREETIINHVGFEPDVWPCPLSVEVGAGVSCSLNKYVMLSLGLEYEHGLNYYYQAPLKGDSFTDFRRYTKPVGYSSEKGYDEARYSMTDTFHLKRKAVWINLGVVFKF